MAKFSERALGCVLTAGLCVGLAGCSDEDTTKKPAGNGGSAGSSSGSGGSAGSSTAGTGATGGSTGGTGATAGTGAVGGTAAVGGTGATGGLAGSAGVGGTTGGTAGTAGTAGTGGACAGKDMLGCDVLKLTGAIKAGGGSPAMNGFTLNETTLQVTAELAADVPTITRAKLVVHFCECNPYYPRCDTPSSPSNGQREFPVTISATELTSDLSALASTSGLLIDHLSYELETECGETIHAVMQNDSELDSVSNTCSVNFGKFMFCDAAPSSGDGNDPDPVASSTRTPASCGSNPSVAGATAAAPVSVNCFDLVTNVNFDSAQDLVLTLGSGLPALTSSSVTLSQCAGEAQSCAAGVHGLVTVPLFENGSNLETTLSSAATASGRIHAATVRLETACNATYLISASNPETASSFALHHCYGFEP